MATNAMNDFNRYRFTIVHAVLLFSGLSLHAQNLEEISLKKKITISGSFNLNTVGYTCVGIPQRRDPFNWFSTGSLTVDLFGYAAPFSFSYSNANRSFSQPFNQFSFTPQYKWVKGYVGYSSMTFSPYTLSGHVFFGGGAELTPGKWRIALMYGRLRKAVPYDLTDSLQHGNAAYKRMGYGVKIGYEASGNAVSMNVFTAKDDPESLPFVLQERVITPQQNVAISIAGRKTFLKRLFIEAEYAVSALNSNVMANTEVADSVYTSRNFVQGLLRENSTSRYFDAVNAGLGYQGKTYMIQLKYERVAPEYHTLGAYYFNNDIRNITIAPTVRLLKNKLIVAANAGFQKNNLNKTRASTMLRTVGAYNLQYLPNEKWSVNGSYSNFSSYTNMRPQEDPLFQNSLDTLNFYQVSETFTGSVSRSLGAGDRPQLVMITGSYQKASNKSATEAGAQLSDFISGNISYSYSLTPSNLSLSIGTNVYTNNVAGLRSSFVGPVASATKSLLEKKLRCSYSSSYSHTSGNGVKTSPVWSNQLGISYAPKEKEGRGRNNLSLGISLVRRLKNVGEQPAFTEATGTLNYSHSF